VWVPSEVYSYPWEKPVGLFSWARSLDDLSGINAAPGKPRSDRGLAGLLASRAALWF